MIQVALLDSFGIASAGLYGRSESYLYTVEALQTYLNTADPGRRAAVTRWLALPPRDTLKLFVTAIAALEREGVADPSRGLAMIRGWKTVTLLVKNEDFPRGEILVLDQERYGFPAAYHCQPPGRSAAPSRSRAAIAVANSFSVSRGGKASHRVTASTPPGVSRFR